MKDPKVSIIITAFSPAQKRYLDLCVKSVKNLNYENKEIIVVSNKPYSPYYDGVRTVLFEDTNYHNPEALNRGFREASPDSEYFLMLNDDVVCTKNSLKNMVNAAKSNKLIIGPISPCDNQWIYLLAIGFKDKNGGFAQFSDRFYRYEQLVGYHEELMNSESVYPHGLILQPFLCLFAHLIPRAVWEKVGPFDENFKTGQDDVDYCWRARQKGILSAVALDSFIFHFGGVSSDKGISRTTRDENEAYFLKKWGVKAPT